MIAACLVIGYAGCALHKEVLPPPETKLSGAKPSSGLPAPGAPSIPPESERVLVSGSNIPTPDIEKHGISKFTPIKAPATVKHGFPWPPPWASAFDVIPHAPLAENRAHPKLNDVANKLENALATEGYYERSYYPILDGFAIATHIEQINEDGTSKKSGRWLLDVPMLETFSVSAYVHALFRAPYGRYRVIVFVVTTHPFTQSDAKVTRQQATDWLSAGYDSLPDEIGRREFSANYKCTALIYEFKGTGKSAEFVDPSQLQGRTHLIKSGLMAALSTR